MSPAMAMTRLGALVLAGLSLGAACRSGEGPLPTGGVGGARRTDRLIVARAADAVDLDPARVTSFESHEVADALFARLVRFVPGSIDIAPDLATSWTRSDDRLTWTFQLAPGRRFHDGTPVDADAVVFSLTRQRDEDGSKFPWSLAFRIIERVTALSPTEVRIDLQRPFAPLLPTLAMPAAAIVSPTAVRRLGDDFGRAPVGAGPYRFVEWIAGDRITLERVRADGVGPRFLVFVTLADAVERRAALESGAIDIDRQVAPEDAPFVGLHPDLLLHVQPAAAVAYLAMNTSRAPWSDVRVRRAVAHALRREALARVAFQGLAEPAVGPLPPTIPGARTDLMVAAFDPERARTLLREAGVMPGATAEPYRLYVPSVPRQYLPDPLRIAQVVRASLAQIGLPVRIVASEPREHGRAIKAGEHDLALHGWLGDTGDPDNFLHVLLGADQAVPGGQNVAFWRDAAFTTAVNAAEGEADPVVRARLYGEAQGRFASELPWVVLAHPRLLFATRADVVGVTVGPTGLASFGATRILR